MEDASKKRRVIFLRATNSRPRGRWSPVTWVFSFVSSIHKTARFLDARYKDVFRFVEHFEPQGR